MPRNYWLIVCLFMTWLPNASAQQKTIQERLGYGKDSKLLIIHADDLGVAHAENSASLQAMKQGSVRSGSVMVPCPWFSEMAAYARSNPQADIGLHLTLTSEWKWYKWGPVAGRSKVPSLVNDAGYFFSSVDSLFAKAKLPEVEEEIGAQIEMAIQAGLHPTHLDAHMACLFINPDYLQILIKMGRKYHIPVLLNGPAFKAMFNFDLGKYTTAAEVEVSQIFMAQPSDFAGGMQKFYTGVFGSVRPGLSCILLHAAYDNDEMKAITIDHPDYGAAWRQADFDFFSSPECRQLLEKNNIHLVTWKEVRDKLFGQEK